MYLQSDHTPGAPPLLDRIIKKALSIDRDLRYASADDMEIELIKARQALKQQGVPFHTPQCDPPPPGAPHPPQSAPPPHSQLVTPHSHLPPTIKKEETTKDNEDNPQPELPTPIPDPPPTNSQLQTNNSQLYTRTIP